MSFDDVVITGLGSMSVFGAGVPALWLGLHTGRSAAAPAAFDAGRYRVRGVYEVPSAALAALPDDDYAVRLSAAAADEALAQAGLSGHRATLSGAGLAFASTSAGWHHPAEAFGAATPATALMPLLRKELPAVAVAAGNGLTGPFAVMSSACASSTGALAWAVERIRGGDAPVMLVGAVDVLTEVVFAGFHAMRLLTGERTRPFSLRRNGFVLAEGAAFLVLESARHARSRGGEPLAAVLGWGASADRAHLTTPAADGIARSVRAALADARSSADAIRVCYAHGTASPAGDAAEAAALVEVFGPGRPVVTAIKAATGHTEGAAGMFSLVAAVHGMGLGQVPPVLYTDDQDPATGDVRLASAATVSIPAAPVLVHSSGFGGVNSSVVLDIPPVRDSRAPARGDAADPASTEARVLVMTNSDGGTWPAGAARPADPSAGAEVPAPAWPRNPPPDAQCRMLGEAVRTALAHLDPDTRQLVRNGALLSGTEFGAQAHHARIYADLTAAGPRAVEPLDFALSTFNLPATMAALALDIGGQVETFLGATGGVEALASACHLVATGRVGATLAVGHDAPENRCWQRPEEPPVPARATVFAVGQGHAGVGVAGVRRLAPAGSLPELTTLRLAVQELAGTDVAVWCDAVGLTAEQTAAVRQWPGWTVVCSEAGAAAPLDVHASVVERVARGEPAEAVVVSTGWLAPTVIIRYRR
jgi:3-oxoacyl-[acyl-carrier-protein] synthase II